MQIFVIIAAEIFVSRKKKSNSKTMQLKNRHFCKEAVQMAYPLMKTRSAILLTRQESLSFHVGW